MRKKCAKSVQHKHMESITAELKLLTDNELQKVQETGGGGIRTPVKPFF